MALRMMARRIRLQVQTSSGSGRSQLRSFSDKRLLSEEEKAAENIYIKVPARALNRSTVPVEIIGSTIICFSGSRGRRGFKKADINGPSITVVYHYYRLKMEKERAEKLAAKGLTEEVPAAGSAATSAKPGTSVQTQDGGYRNTAVIAGVVAAVAAYWLLSGSSKKVEKEKE